MSGHIRGILGGEGRGRGTVIHTDRPTNFEVPLPRTSPTNHPNYKLLHN